VEKNGTYYSGLAYGKFEAVVDLPAGLDLDKMEAHLHEGVLDIQIPLSVAMKPKQIRVSAEEPRRTLAA
jgi:HSP20 family molecular chaperone IbpA